LISLVLGLLCLLAVYATLPFLSGGDPTLGDLIVLGMALTVPALIVGVLRGAASGQQMWTAVGYERLVNVVLRIVAFTALLASGQLTVLTATLVSCLSPIVAGVVYWRLFTAPPAEGGSLPDGLLRPLLSFGSRTWFGAVASMLLARIGQILMVPLSNVHELGLYSVASTISDLPLIVALAIQGTLYGVNSKERDPRQLTVTARLTLLVGFLGCLALGLTLPLWIGPLFGAEFGAATVPTLMLMASAVICIPGLMAATGISAWGRPGLRSIGLGVTLVLNVAVFVLLVPPLGVYGACWTSIVSNVALTGFMVLAASRVMGVPMRDFLLVRRVDVALLWRESRRMVGRLRSGTRRAGQS
jgi:O-antigen/teichoic acid export membrane protein